MALRKRWWMIVLCTVAVLAAGLAASAGEHDAGGIGVETRIIKATVFPNHAEITRQGETTLAAKGPARLDLLGLGYTLSPDSFRVGGAGTAQVRIVGTSLEQVYNTRDMDNQIAELTALRNELQAKDQALKDDMDSYENQKRFVSSLTAAYAQKEGENMGSRPLNIKDWQGAGEFIQRQIQGIYQRIRQAQQQRTDLAEKIAKINADLNNIQSKRGRWSTTAHVEVDVLKPGAFSLTATYLMPGAWWNMQYDARLDPRTGEVEMGAYASIRQQTGEDWDEVTLALSTADPSISGSIPELQSTYVDFLEPLPTRTRSTLSYGGGEAAQAPEMMSAALYEADEAEKNDASGEQTRYEAQQVEATVDTVGLATFTAPRKVTAPSDNKMHKVFLLSRTWATQPHYELVPELSPYAYLAARTTNNFEFPLLAGDIALYQGGDYVGKASIGTVQAGEEMLLSFGVDNRVTVSRTLLNRKEKQQGVINKDTVLNYRYVLSVRNTRKDKDVTVRLYERMPVSRQKDIVVTLDAGSDKNFKPVDQKPGVMMWEQTVKAGATVDIPLNYTIQYPRNKTIIGAP